MASTTSPAAKSKTARDPDAVQRDIEATKTRLGDNLAELVQRTEPKTVSEQTVGWVKDTDQGKVAVIVGGGVVALVAVAWWRRRARRRRVIRALERLGM